jgi:hypothetical protein
LLARRPRLETSSHITNKERKPFMGRLSLLKYTIKWRWKEAPDAEKVVRRSESDTILLAS